MMDLFRASQAIVSSPPSLFTIATLLDTNSKNSLYTCSWAVMCIHVEVRGYETGIASLLMHVCSRDETQAGWLARASSLTETKNVLLSSVNIPLRQNHKSLQNF